MVVDESDWTASSGVDAAAEREKSILQKLAELEKKQKEKEVEEKRAERQQKIQQSAIFNPNASPNTKIGKGTKVLSKKEKERRMKAAQKAQDFVEQLAAKASKSAQKHVRETQDSLHVFR